MTTKKNTTANVAMYNAIVSWAGKYDKGNIFGGCLTDGKAIYASNKMFNHYYQMACKFI